MLLQLNTKKTEKFSEFRFAKKIEKPHSWLIFWSRTIKKIIFPRENFRSIL